ncbi:nuclear transport factor 2 family protein [Sphingobium xenophagum]|uniref:SnoaL-like domain-containing protein n=1 Tax=Sphingobium xenophagum TaxID=121428 RepID=A0A401J8K5_SPHXE|nr:nuclear transport factor 2 family protein [Sphingobium xenophagum]GBH32961.1 hypothetical protein MBESOW_P4187 [Sphingobium xenophagum]
MSDAIDIAAFNRAWLEAWTVKSVDRILAFYHPDIAYYDDAAPGSVHGHEALRALLDQVFAATPGWVMHPDAVWPIEGGFCGRWYMDLGEGPEAVRLRGFDHCLLRDGLIVHNEVYTHRIAGA